MIPLKKRIEIRNRAQATIKEKHFYETIEAFKDGLTLDPNYYWYYLAIGDIYYFELNDPNIALKWYEKPIEKAGNNLSTDTLSPLRYLLKRLSKIYFDKEDFEKASYYYKWLISFRPSNFHDTDFINYAKSLVKLNKISEAIEVLKLGEKYSKSLNLRKFLAELQGEEYIFSNTNNILNGYERIPIKTPIIKFGDDICDICDIYTKNIRKKNDIIAVASAVVALSEERAKSVDVIRASPLAKLLSSFVKRDDFPFGGNAPLCNPLAMQIAIEEVGVLRIIFAAILGGILGKIFKRSGLFYKIASPQSALIDDMPGAIPPYDYYVILGPKDSNKTALKIKEKTSIDAAIVDANDLGIAWIVGTTCKGKEREIEKALSDNPQGNGDQQTPIIILRKIGS